MTSTRVVGSKSFVMWVIAILLIAGTATGHECTESMKHNHCLDCTQDNYCVKCADGYYVVPSLVNPEGGHCNKCAEHCLLCTEEKKCTQCEKGFVAFPDRCTPCMEGCLDCYESPSKCRSCQDHYKLDLEGECYFRYTAISILGAAIGLFLLVIMFSCILGSIKRESRKGHKASKDAGESILGDEFKQAPTLISDVTQIGRTSDIDRDLSLVIDPNEIPVQVNSPEDSIREDELFEDSGIQIGKPIDSKKNPKLSYLNRKK